jgi:hypothetical protein
VLDTTRNSRDKPKRQSTHKITKRTKQSTMKLSFALLAASAVAVSGFGVAPAAFTSHVGRTSVIVEASRNKQKIASRSAWAESRGLGGAAATTAEGAAAGLMTGNDGLEYVKLVHPSGASSEVYLYGGVVTSYKDADGTEFIAVRPDAKMDGSKPISGGLSHCWPQVSFCYPTIMDNSARYHGSSKRLLVHFSFSLDQVRSSSTDSLET